MFAQLVPTLVAPGMVVRLAASARLYKLSGIQPLDAVTIALIRDPNDEESILKHNTHQNRKRSYQVHIQSTREAPITNHQSSINNPQSTINT
jgi:hypothetical protein